MFHNLVVLAAASTFLPLLGWSGGWLARRKSASLRNLIWRLVFLGAATAAVCTVFQWRVELLVLPPVPVVLPAKSSPASAASRSSAPSVVAKGTPVASTAAPREAKAIPALPSRRPSLLLLAVVAWGIGTAWMLLALVAGWIRLVILLRKQTDAPPATWEGLSEDEAGAMIRVGLSNQVKAPLLAGLWDPMVVFPREAIGWPLERIRMTLAHEREHVRRGDVPFLLFARTVLAACWFNPLLWLAFRRLQAEAEAAADDAVVIALHQAPEYASNLLEIVREMRSGPTGLFPAVGIAESSPIEARVRKILDPHLDRSRLTRRIVWTMGVGCVLAAVAALTLHFTAPLAKARLVGQITDNDGKPLAGVHVSIENAWVRDGTSPLCPSSYADCGRETITDASGNFAFEKLDPTQFFAVVMAKAGYAPLKRNYDPAKGPKHAKLSVRSEADLIGKGIVRGKVVNTEGIPLPEATVALFAFHRGKTTTFTSNGGDPLAVTDEKGEFLLATVPDIDQVNVKVSAAGLAPRISDALSVGSENAAISMDQGAMVTGRLLRHGRPVVGAKVGLCQMTRNSSVFLGDLSETTDGQGRFTFRNVPSHDLYYVYARREGFDGVTEPKVISAREPGSTVDAGDLEAVPGIVTEVEVRLRDGAPIPPDTRAMAEFDTLWDAQLAFLDEGGRYRVRAFPGEKVGVTVTVPGYKVSPANSGYDKLNGFSTSFVAGKVQGRYILTLDRESDLLPPVGEANHGGIVLGPNGAPTPGASVTIFGADDYCAITNGDVHVVRFPRQQAKSDDQGRFVVTGPIRGAMIYAASLSGGALMDVEDFHGEIRLQPWGRIEGTVLVDGKPQPGRRVEAFHFPMGGVDQVQGYIKNVVHADAAGHYEILSVLPGLVQLSSTNGEGASQGEFQEFLHADVNPGATTMVDLRPRGATVQGKLILPPNWKQGQQYDVVNLSLQVSTSWNFPSSPQMSPEETARLRKAYILSPEGRKAYVSQRIYSTQAASDGSFAFRDVPAGDYAASFSVMKWHPGTSPEWLPVVWQSPSVAVTEDDAKDRRAVEVDSQPMTCDPLPPQVGEAMPDFSVQVADGTTVTRDSFRGRFLLVRVVTFGDAELSDRETEMDKMLRDLGHPANLTVLDVDFYHSNPAPRMKLAASYPKTWLIAHESTDGPGLAQRLFIHGTPCYLLVDPSGKVIVSKFNDLYHLTGEIAKALGK